MTTSEVAAELKEPRGNGLLQCPNCITLLSDPTSTNYLGLGRIEHSWQCHGCGEVFRTTARMAGMVEVEVQAFVVAPR